MCGICRADLYEISSFVEGPEITESGTIQTDGTTGALSSADIFNWNIRIAVSDPLCTSGSASLDRSDSTIDYVNAFISATTQALYLESDNSDPGSIQISEGNSAVLIYTVYPEFNQLALLLNFPATQPSIFYGAFTTLSANGFVQPLAVAASPTLPEPGYVIPMALCGLLMLARKRIVAASRWRI